MAKDSADATTVAHGAGHTEGHTEKKKKYRIALSMHTEIDQSINRNSPSNSGGRRVPFNKANCQTVMD